jgi:hypothetical protein
LGRHAWLLSQRKRHQRSQPAGHESPYIAPIAVGTVVEILTAPSTIVTRLSTTARSHCSHKSAGWLAEEQMRGLLFICNTPLAAMASSMLHRPVESATHSCR